VRPRRSWPLGLLLCTSVCIATNEPSCLLKNQPSDPVARWVDDLGSDSYEARESATRALMELEEEPPLLRQALQSPNLEVRRRAALIRDAHVAKQAQRGLLKVHALAKEGRID
jgi:hypothetical protein